MRTRTVIGLLLLIPLVDALLLVPIAGALGLVTTVALVVLTGLVGMLLVRAEGRHTLSKLQAKAARGEAPTDELLDGALLIAAGAFLLTPGVVTDAIGFLLALPPTRYPIRAVLKTRVVVPYLDEQTGGFVTGGVWTSGFPGPDDADGGGGAGPFGPGGAGSPGSGPDDGVGPTGAGGGPDGFDGEEGDDDVVDLDGDSYRASDS